MSSRPSTASSSVVTPTSSLHRFTRRSLAPSSLFSASASCSSSASTCAWSAFDEVLGGPTSSSSRNGPKESRKARTARRRAEELAFNIDTPPTLRELFAASVLEVIDDSGTRVSFGDLVRNRKTIVVFIRHWFCPLCAQYMNSILAEVSLDALEEAGVDLIIIGNGSAKMLNGYRNKAFKCPFRMYTDPTLALYRALGLTRQTGDAGPDADKGAYLVQTPLESTMQTLKRATQMPLRNPGHFTQLGGEFIFDGTLRVTYTHRMSTTRDHAPIRDVCAEAGVSLEFIHYEPGEPPPPVHQFSWSAEMGRLEDDEDEGLERDRRVWNTHASTGANAWREERDRQVDAIIILRKQRRMRYSAGSTGTELGKGRGVGNGEVRVVGDDEVADSEELDGALGIPN